jgi:catechol 2,3-dioxygenase
MAIKGVLRSSMAQIRVLDLEETLKHYTEVLGLDEVGRTEDGRVMLKAYDEFDHHSFVLRKADEAGIDFLGWKVESEAFLDDLAARTEAWGLPVTWVEANTDQPGYGRRFQVTLATGHRFEFYATVGLSEDAPGTLNPDIYKRVPKGMGPDRFDHALLYGPNSAEAHRYCIEVMEMAVVEKLEIEEGNNLCLWLSCNNKAHDVAILEHAEPNKLHHIGFHLEGWHEIGHAADLISIHDVSLDAGPMRHGITRGQTIYFFDPSGNRNETFAGGYMYFNDNPTRKWDMDHAGKGVFYYTRQLNERFLSVVS